MNRKMWRRILFYTLHSIGFILLYLVVKNLDFRKLLTLMMDFPAWKVVLGLILLVLVYLIKTLRWLSINSILDIRTGYSNLFVFFLFSGFLSAITPGRLGELAKIWFLKKKYPVSLPLATSSVLLDRLWDVILMSMMALSSMVLLISRFEFMAWSVILIAVLLLGCLLAILFPAIIFKPLLFVVRRQDLKDEIESVFRLWVKNRYLFLVPGLSTSLAAFLLLALIPVMFSVELNAPVSFTTSISAVSLSNILSSIPVTVAGFGTRELVFTQVWGLNGYEPEVAISVSTVYFIITYLGSMLLGGIVYLVSFRKIFRLKDLQSKS
jgi:uncharacterized protein (TIRG00374 family)